MAKKSKSPRKQAGKKLVTRGKCVDRFCTKWIEETKLVKKSPSKAKVKRSPKKSKSKRIIPKRSRMKKSRSKCKSKRRYAKKKSKSKGKKTT